MKRIYLSAMIVLLGLLAAGTVWSAAGTGPVSPSVPVDRIEQPAPPPPQWMDLGSVNPQRSATYWVPPIPLPVHTGPLKPRQITSRDFYFNVVDVSRHDRLVIKFTEEAYIRWAMGRTYSKSGASTAQLDAFLAKHPEISMDREFNEIPEATLDYYETNGERNTNQDLANLNNFYELTIDNNQFPMALIVEASKIDIVETVFYRPKAAEATCTDIAPATPDYSGNQTFEGPAPTGLNAIWAGTYHPAGRGRHGAWTVDIEWNWTEGHEDFNQDVAYGYGFEVLEGGDGGGTADHGDACSGIIGACNNGFGMTGESYNVTPKAISVSSRAEAVAIALAQGHLYAGESMFIEMHAPGPYPGYSCNTACGNCEQFTYIAMEYWDDDFAAIQTATANNRIVYEAGGNGQMNLDAAVYGNRFNRNYRDSGAILIGATHPTTQVAECWSSYGSRIDMNGWGEQVYTLGYGYLYNPTGNRNQMYTNSFGGTSSATPIVTAAGNCLQGIAQEKYGITLTPSMMRTMLAYGGTPYSGTHAVGVRPNLAMAVNTIEPDLVPYTLAGWAGSLVPRFNNSAAIDLCEWTPLYGNSATTYLNVAGKNINVSPAPDSSSSGSVVTRIYLDNEYIRGLTWGRIEAQQAFASLNTGPHTVRGGRHSLEWKIDPLDAINEFSETNNNSTLQAVWSPLQRTAHNNIAVRAVPPLKTAGDPSYYNCDGFRGTAASGTYWLGFAVMPQTGVDIDAFCFDDSYSTLLGFETPLASSARGSGYSDLVIVNGNLVGAPPSRLFSAVRYSDASTEDYASEVDAAVTASYYPPYSRTTSFSAHEIMDMYEIHLTAGMLYYVGVHDVTGGLKLAVNVYPHSRSYGGFYDYEWQNISNTDDGNATILRTADTTGWYMAVVMKNTSEDYGVSGGYTFEFVENPQPNLLPGATLPGWSAPMVVRHLSDATEASAVIPPILNSYSVNYFSMSWHNSGLQAVPTGAAHGMQLDGIPLTSWTAALMAPLSHAIHLNAVTASVHGGRHTLSYILDGTNLVSETNETDNNYSAQYVWSPLPLTRAEVHAESAPPLRGNGTYMNCDGYSFTLPSNVGNAVAILSPAWAADYDVIAFSDYSGSSSGYSTMLDISASGYDQPDYVVIPYRLSSTGYTYYPGVINWNSSTDSVYVEAQHTVGRISSTGRFTSTDPDTLASRQIINLYEVRLNAGQEYHFDATVQSGTANIGLRLFRDSLTVRPRNTAVAMANGTGNGGSESLIYTAPYSDYYILAVEKTNSSSANLSSIYTMQIGPTPAGIPPIDDLVVQQYGSSYGIRLAWNHVNTDSLGSPLSGRRYVIYRNASFNLVPFPADSIGGTTDSTFTDRNATGLINFYRVKVVSE